MNLLAGTGRSGDCEISLLPQGPLPPRNVEVHFRLRSIVELHARARRLTARNAERLGNQVQHESGVVWFESGRREISSEKGLEPLTSAESQILFALASAGGAIISRQDLYRKRFGREERYGERAPETYIGRLRQKLTSLGEDGVQPIPTE